MGGGSSREQPGAKAVRAGSAAGAFAAAGSKAKDVRIKCHYEGAVRTVHSSYVPTFAGLTKRLKSDYGFEVSLTYLDEDGDKITLSSQNDFDEMFDYCKRSNFRKIDMYVTQVGSLGRVNRSRQQDNGADHDTVPPLRAGESDRRIRWRRGELLGEGAFGKVFLCLNLDDGNLMAVKQITIKSHQTSQVAALEAEVSVMKSLNSKHIVQFLGTERYAETLSIFMEYISGGSIASLLIKFGAFDCHVVQRYTRQIVLGLDHLHSHGVAHRDIKGANILVDNSGIVKLTDFGGAINLKESPDGVTGEDSAKGTAYWMAPEVIRQRATKSDWKKSDIWSLGCTVVEMATGKPPWSNYSNPVTALYQIACRRAAPPLPDTLTPEATAFLGACFKPEPTQRPETAELLTHAFMQAAPLSAYTAPSPASQASSPATKSSAQARGAQFTFCSTDVAGGTKNSASPAASPASPALAKSDSENRVDQNAASETEGETETDLDTINNAVDFDSKTLINHNYRSVAASVDPSD
jgi:serine/threonine protein kinase